MLRPDDVYVLQSLGPSQPWRFAQHQHDGWSELQFLVEGKLHQQVNGHDEDLSAGDLLLVRRDDEHVLHGHDFLLFNLAIPDSEWQRLSEYLGGNTLTALLEQTRPPRLRVVGHERTRIEAELRQLFTAQRTPQARILVARLLLNLLPRMSPALNPPTTDAQPRTPLPPWLRPIIDNLDQLIDEGADPAVLATRARVSPEHLARSVRRHFNLTPTALLNRRRLERAALLLSHSDRSVLNIALDLGFGSASAFSRSFRAHHHLAPRTWRAKFGVGFSS